MSGILSTSILAQMAPTEYRPADPGGPNYIGAIDYPKTVYKGYIGSTNYVYEPRANGYKMIDTSQLSLPVARFPKTQEYKSFNKRSASLLEPIFGECSLPLFFLTSEDQVKHCTYQYSLRVFKIAFTLNFLVSLVYYKKVNKTYIAVFVMFHLLLYFILTKFFVQVATIEWKTSQKYRFYVKKDKDFSEFDTPIRQFDEIQKFLSNEVVTRQKILTTILMGSIIFCWIPILVAKKQR